VASNTVTAQTYWTWTRKAEEEDPKRHRAGERVWPHYEKEAPARWLEDGLICDSMESEKEGQTDLFDYIGG
jgi:hypothetical protein